MMSLTKACRILVLPFFISVFFLLSGKVLGQSNNLAKKTDFRVIEAKDEKGNLVIMTLDFLYKNYSDKKVYPWYLVITIKTVDQNSKGYPTSNEATVLNDFEDYLEDNINKVCKAQFVGRTTLVGYRDLIFYIDNPERCAGTLDKLVQSLNLKREFEYNIQEDPKWENVNHLFAE